MPFRRYLKRDFMMFSQQWFEESCEILLVYSERENVGERWAPSQAFRQNRSVFFVQLCPRLDLGHNQAHYGAVIDGCKAVEPRWVRRNVLVPTIARVNVISIESGLFLRNSRVLTMTLDIRWGKNLHRAASLRRCRRAWETEAGALPGCSCSSHLQILPRLFAAVHYFLASRCTCNRMATL